MRIDERFEMQQHLVSTRTSDAYQAVDRETSAASILWLLRHPLEKSADGARRFVDRIATIRDLKCATPKVGIFGVDDNNRAYLATDFVHGTPLVTAKGDAAERQRWFEDLVLIVAEFHDKGVVLGDIGEKSFFVTGNGRVMLQGVLGDFEIDTSGTTMMPAPETMRYLSPEQQGGTGAIPASDVFSIGLLGYRLFAGRHISKDKGPLSNTDVAIATAPAPSSQGDNVPYWVDEILGQCLDSDPERRFHTARSLADAIIAARQGNYTSEHNSRWSQRTVMVRPDTLGAVRETSSSHDDDLRSLSEKIQRPVSARPSTYAPHDDQEGSRPTRVFAFLGLGFMMALIATAVVMVSMGEKGAVAPPADLANEMKKYEAVAPEELKKPIRDVASVVLSLEERKKALEEVANSNDPVAYTVLLSTIRSAPKGELRGAAEQLIIERISKGGLSESAQVIGIWFQRLAESGLRASSSPAYELLLAACNTSHALIERRKALGSAYQFEPIVSRQLAAALSLDSEDSDDFTPVLRELLSSNHSRKELRNRGVGALILATPELAVLFEQRVLRDLGELSVGDLAWVLVKLAENGSELIFPIAEETLKRDVVPPFQAVFLHVLSTTDRYNLPVAVKRSLTRAARAEIADKDVVAIGRWLSRDADQVLLAFCALANDSEVALSAFDTLAARSIDTEPAQSLVDWVKGSYWEYREQLVKAVGVIGLVNIASEEQIEFALDQLMPFSIKGRILRVMLSTGNELLIRKTLERVGSTVPSPELLPLLEHENKYIRIEVIKELRGRNELGVLQAIYKAYEREKDKEVREVYRTIHWVTRGRDRQPKDSVNPSPNGG